MIIRILSLFLIFSLFGCGGAKFISVATGGHLANDSFHRKIDCVYDLNHLFIDVEINGKTYLFLFDTGYEVSMIDQDLLDSLAFHPMKKQKTIGSSFDETKIVYGYLDQLSIDGISFNDIGVGIQDLSFISSPFKDRKVQGVIGANILRKAFWQINYQQKSILFSDQLSNVLPALDSNTIILDMTPRNTSGWGLSFVDVTIDDVTAPFVFDTGSSGALTGSAQLFHKLKSTSVFRDSTHSPLKIEQLFLEENRITDVSLDFGHMTRNLMGNAFLNRFIVTMDWQQNKLYLTSSSEK